MNWTLLTCLPSRGSGFYVRVLRGMGIAAKSVSSPHAGMSTLMVHWGTKTMAKSVLRQFGVRL